jgi:vacuolar-type H+-ATPase subunit I/STV1
MRRTFKIIFLMLVLGGLPLASIPAQKEAALSDEEEDRLREEQDPGKRVELYLDFAQDRLGQFDQFRQKPADPKYDTGAYLDKLLGQYITLQDELKNWIQYQYDRQGDMRKGLHTLLDRGPQQLDELRHIQQEPDPFVSDYRDSLRDAIDNLNDILDGATNALNSQQKKFGELKREEKVDEQQAKQAAKDEKKRIKEEEKLRKKERKQGQVPEDADQN